MKVQGAFQELSFPKGCVSPGTGQKEPGRQWSGPWEGDRSWASSSKNISVTPVAPFPASAQTINPDPGVKLLYCTF